MMAERRVAERRGRFAYPAHAPEPRPTPRKPPPPGRTSLTGSTMAERSESRADSLAAAYVRVNLPHLYIGFIERGLVEIRAEARTRMAALRSARRAAVDRLTATPGPDEPDGRDG